MTAYVWVGVAQRKRTKPARGRQDTRLDALDDVIHILVEAAHDFLVLFKKKALCAR